MAATTRGSGADAGDGVAHAVEGRRVGRGLDRANTAIDLLSAAIERYDAGDLVAAERLCRSALADDAANLGRSRRAATHRLLGIIARKTSRLDESESYLREASELAPDDALCQFELGSTLLAKQDREGALACFRAAAEKNPTLSETVLNAGAILETLERYDEALPWQRRAVELRPRCHLSHFNLANSLRATGDVVDSIQHYRSAIEIAPNYARGHWNLAVALLTHGEFAEGWREHEWRDEAGEVPLDVYPYPRWQGESLAGKRLLVFAEQGIGDEVLFASCYPDLVAQAEQCVFVCDPRLAPLFKRSFPAATVHGYVRRADRRPLPLAEPIDLQTPAGSVPRWLRSDVSKFPRRDRFLAADEQQTAAWRQRFMALGGGIKVGLSWRAGGKPGERRKRTTGLEQWAELFAIPGVEWINLQYGDATDDLREARERLGVDIHDFADGDPLVDMDAFAAKVSALDLVISVGNATVHLAGALGVCAWAMLPLVPAWRWLDAGEASPWYSSVRLFRQTDRGNWSDVFSKLAAALRARLGHESPHLPDAGAGKNATGGKSPQVAMQFGGGSDTKSVSFVELNDAEIANLMSRALAHHQSGQLTEAETIYRDVLLHAPRHADALHLIGQLYCRTNRADQGIPSLRRAIAVADQIPVFYVSLGDALTELGQSGEAADAYRQAVNLAPTDGQIRLRLARALRAACLIDAAIEELEMAIDLMPNSARPLAELADLLLEDERPTEALGHALAAACLAPGDLSALEVVGRAQRAAGNLPAALSAWRDALQIDPQHLSALRAASDAFLEQNQPDGAADCLRKAAALRPDDGAIQHALGLALQEAGELDAAQLAFDRAVVLDASSAAAHSSRATLNLLRGRFAQGWDEYEWRWKSSTRERAKALLADRVWMGDALVGRPLVIFGEQGVGDEIMFATCYADAIRRAERTAIVCDHRLRSLFARSFPTAEVYGVCRGQEHSWRLPASVADGERIFSGSLPRLFRRAVEEFPDCGRWLIPDERLCEHWRKRLDDLGPELKVGISWRGGRSAKDRRLRWTSLDDWAPVFQVPGVRFVSLQHDMADEEVRDAESRFGDRIHTWSDFDPVQSIDSLAALVASLDLVICVSNANAHVAGALDRPTWCLPPKTEGWRWTLGRSHSLWYRSVQLFRQRQIGDWRATLTQVADELVKFAGEHRR